MQITRISATYFEYHCQKTLFWLDFDGTAIAAILVDL